MSRTFGIGKTRQTTDSLIRAALGWTSVIAVTYERSTGATEAEMSRFQVMAEWFGTVEDGYTLKVKATGPGRQCWSPRPRRPRTSARWRLDQFSLLGTRFRIR